MKICSVLTTKSERYTSIITKIHSFEFFFCSFQIMNSFSFIFSSEQKTSD